MKKKTEFNKFNSKVVGSNNKFPNTSKKLYKSKYDGDKENLGKRLKMLIEIPSMLGYQI